MREGKRRQFSYIGRLLRDVEPELIDGLIRATKDGVQQKFQELSGSDKSEVGDADEEEEETDNEDEDEVGFIKIPFCFDSVKNLNIFFHLLGVESIDLIRLYFGYTRGGNFNLLTYDL